MLFKQFLVAAIFTLGSVAALPEANQDGGLAARDIEVEPRDVNNFEIEARDLDGDDESHLVARGEQFHRRHCRHGYRRYGHHRCCSWRHGRRHCYRRRW
ncbi:hypothetical protein HIM_10892 [Hirsutella minnesotensis 3608]|uniref:Uncharacterized protein n=1 Tax=Hirsutella minnesotensis 3608 TaxID=1043627 RepID=A0A0F7ZRJ5_9HYPO|nr:hypothetical protein HIM_10892 [Hirsutella minnesotensis 3608]